MRISEPGVPQGTRGPDDDFFCHKYQVWYQVDDCVYRGQNQTFPGCANCFQGHLNIRSVEKGIRPPAFLGGDPGTPADSTASGVLYHIKRG